MGSGDPSKRTKFTGINYWGVIERLAFASKIRDLIATGIGGGIPEGIITDVQKCEFIEDATVWLWWERMIRAEMETHPPILIKLEKASHVLDEDNIHRYYKGCKWCTVMVGLDGHPDLVASAKKPLGAESTS